jgi:integrase
MAKALTVKSIEAIKPGATRREIPDGLMRGLFLVIQKSGTMAWAVRYRHKGVSRKLTLGPHPGISLKDARALAGQALVKVAEGKDPAGEKKAAKVAAERADRDLVEQVAERYVSIHCKPNNRSWREQERLLERNVVAKWRGRSLRDITRRDVHDLLDSIIEAGTPVTANRVFSGFRAMCRWAIGRDIIEVSPCAGILLPHAEVSRDRILSDDELRTIYRACADTGYPFGPLFQLLALTGARLSEVADMEWSEITGDIWTLPPARSKNKTAHTVPLCKPAMDILGALPRIGDAGLVFTWNGSTSVSGHEKPLRIIRKLMPDSEHWSLHDLRRTCASGMARLGVPIHVIEAVLNHRSGVIRGVARIYNRYSYEVEKRQALETWGRYVMNLISEKPASNVVEFASSRN